MLPSAALYLFNGLCSLHWDGGLLDHNLGGLGDRCNHACGTLPVGQVSGLPSANSPCLRRGVHTVGHMQFKRVQLYLAWYVDKEKNEHEMIAIASSAPHKDDVGIADVPTNRWPQLGSILKGEYSLSSVASRIYLA